MMSITSVCLTLFLVATIAQSGPVNQRPQVITARVGVTPKDDNIITAQNGHNGTQTTEPSVKDDISKLVSDNDIAPFAKRIVETFDRRSNGGELFKEMILGAPPGNERMMMKRRITNIKVFLKALSGLYKDPEEYSSIFYSKELSKETQEKIIKFLVNGVIGRLEPKPCLREFVGAFLFLKIDDLLLHEKPCNFDVIYTSQWYQRTCRHVLEGSGEEKGAVNWLCGAQTEKNEVEDVGYGLVKRNIF